MFRRLMRVAAELLELVEYGFGDGQRKPRQFDRRPKSGRDLEGRGEKARVEQARILPKPPTTRAVAVVVGDSIAAARSR